jgi:hypothetical protein
MKRSWKAQKMWGTVEGLRKLIFITKKMWGKSEICLLSFYVKGRVKHGSRGQDEMEPTGRTYRQVQSWCKESLKIRATCRGNWSISIHALGNMSLWSNDLQSVILGRGLSFCWERDKQKFWLSHLAYSILQLPVEYSIHSWCTVI